MKVDIEKNKDKEGFTTTVTMKVDFESFEELIGLYWMSCVGTSDKHMAQKAGKMAVVYNRRNSKPDNDRVPGMKYIGPSMFAGPTIPALFSINKALKEFIEDNYKVSLTHKRHEDPGDELA